MKLSTKPYRYETRRRGTVDAEWGELEVPERRGGEAGATGAVITLALVRLPGRTNGPPTVFLAGGPGESAIDAGRGRLFELFDALRENGDVILLDQRGCGASRPSLACGEPWRFPPGEPLDHDRALAVALEGSRECAARLREGGVDLDAYNTVENAADVADLVHALDAGPAHLVGTSYGTHLAMAVMRNHPRSVARAVLAGPEGPNHTYKLPSAVQRQLERIDTRARTDLAGSSAADFLGNVEAVLSRLGTNPVAAPSGAVAQRLGRFDVEYIAAVGSADTRLIGVMPAWFARMVAGDFSDFAGDGLVARYFRHLRGGLGTNAVGFCMDCASGASAERLRRIREEAERYPLGRTIDFPFPEVAEAWRVPDLGEAFRAPLHTDVPTLFLTGTWDCRTPEGNVTDLRPGFGDSVHVVIEEAGHTDLLFGAETARRIAAFLRGEVIDPSPIRGAERLDVRKT